MTWYDSNFKDRYPVAINVIGGSETAGTEDVEIVVPKDFDRFWTSIRPDGFDIVIADPDGNAEAFKRSVYNYADRSLTLQADNVNFQNRNSVALLYIYFNNPDQSSDLAGSFVASSPKIGTIALNRPSSLSVGNLEQGQGNDSPAASFQKTEDEEVYIWFRVGSLLTRRISQYNNHLDYEQISYIKVQSLDAAGSNDANRYIEGETRFLPSWVGVKVKAGSAGVDYTIAVEIVTTSSGLTQTLSARALLRIRNLLP
tara:strand:+ start:5178 stop:5945 length:768 start_codon:yes stop_codon:yes gene_type:complete